MKIQLAVASAILLLSACAELDKLEAEADAKQQGADMARCNSQGFATGTEAMATCLATVSAQRQAELNRAAAQSRQLDAEEKAKKTKKAHH